jgi:predicted transcriptional regulator
MTIRMEVCWLRDHFPKLTQEEIASLIDIPQSLVNRYAKLRERPREYAKRQASTNKRGPSFETSVY